MFRNRKGVEGGFRESLMIKREGLEGGGEHNRALAAYLLTLHPMHDNTYVEWSGLNRASGQPADPK